MQRQNLGTHVTVMVLHGFHNNQVVLRNPFLEQIGVTEGKYIHFQLISDLNSASILFLSPFLITFSGLFKNKNDFPKGEDLFSNVQPRS